VSVEAWRSDAPTEPRHAMTAAVQAPWPKACALQQRQVVDASLIVREQTQPGQFHRRPAIIAEKNATTVWSPVARPRDRLDHLVLERVQARERRKPSHDREPGDAGGIQQPLHEHRRADGLQLQNTAYSVNIKERLDSPARSSTPKATHRTRAHAVHLGSMSDRSRR